MRTSDQLLAALAAGDQSLDLSAELCVAMQYVPGVPEARNVTLERRPRTKNYFYLKNNGRDYYAVPDLLRDMNALVACEAAKGGNGVIVQIKYDRIAWEAGRGFLRSPIMSTHEWFEFKAPHESNARAGALFKAYLATGESDG